MKRQMFKNVLPAIFCGVLALGVCLPAEAGGVGLIEAVVRQLVFANPSTTRTSLGLGTGDSPTFTAVVTNAINPTNDLLISPATGKDVIFSPAGGLGFRGSSSLVKAHVEGAPSSGNPGVHLSSDAALEWAATTSTGGATAADTGLARDSAGVVKVTDGSTGSGIVMAGVCLGRLKAADFNVDTDQAITINSSRYVVRSVVVNNASISLTTAAGGVYTAASKGGTALVAAGQVYSALTASTKFVDLTLEAAAGTDVVTATTLYLSLTTPQGAAATADVYVYGDALP